MNTLLPLPFSLPSFPLSLSSSSPSLFPSFYSSLLLFSPPFPLILSTFPFLNPSLSLSLYLSHAGTYDQTNEMTQRRSEEGAYSAMLAEVQAMCEIHNTCVYVNKILLFGHFSSDTNTGIISYSGISATFTAATICVQIPLVMCVYVLVPT